jgi:hypothetical protein
MMTMGGLGASALLTLDECIKAVETGSAKGLFTTKTLLKSAFGLQILGPLM